MRWLDIYPTNPIKGSLQIPGSKNSSLALMAASCLAEDTVCFSNLPQISDTDVVCHILNSLGAKTTREEELLHIDPTSIHNAEIPCHLSSCIRTAYYFVGALLAKHKKVTVGYPGGDNFVSRPIDQHIKGFKALGAKVTLHEQYYTVEADSLMGTDIYFDTLSGGATINILLAAVLAKGKTVLHNAARDPEVVDTAVFLNKMGAKIHGAGTDILRITGVERLFNGCTHTVIPDRLIAGAFLMLPGITGGQLTVCNIIPEHLAPCTSKLKEIGIEFEHTETTITAYSNGKIRAARVRAEKYPLFETDFQQPMTTLLLKARGRSVISDKIYPKRFNHCDQLQRMGADITVSNGVARINSHQKLKGTWVHASDIRAGTSLLLAGMMAEGTTHLTGIEHLERGYENVVRDFQSIGADIRLIHNEELPTQENTLIPAHRELNDRVYY